MKFLACIVLALAVGAFADDEADKKDKRATFGLGYGAYPYNYGAYPYFGGSYPYGAYPYSVKAYGAYPYTTPYYGSLAYSAVVPAKTEITATKDAVVTKAVPAATSVLPYTAYGAYPYAAGAYPYAAGAYPYAAGAYAYPYTYAGYPYNYGFAGKLIK